MAINGTDTDRYEEIIDENFLISNYSRTKLTMTIDHFLTRVFLGIVLFLFVYLIIISIRTINPDVLGLMLITSAGLFLLLLDSERNGNIERRSVTPIQIQEQEILIYVTLFDRINGFNGSIDRNQLSSIHVIFNEKPHSISSILLQPMRKDVGELEFKLKDGTARYSGPKPVKTINEILNFLDVRWNVGIKNN